MFLRFPERVSRDARQSQHLYFNIFSSTIDRSVQYYLFTTPLACVSPRALFRFLRSVHPTSPTIWKKIYKHTEPDNKILRNVYSVFFLCSVFNARLNAALFRYIAGAVASLIDPHRAPQREPWRDKIWIQKKVLRARRRHAKKKHHTQVARLAHLSAGGSISLS